MTKYCGGDASAFRELYAQIAPGLFRYLLRLTRDRSTAEDLVQTTFMKVHRTRMAYIDGADPLPWIYAIAHRTFIDSARRDKRTAARFVASASQPEAPEPGPARDEDQPARITAVIDALATLPAAQREAVVLMKLEGHTATQAAAIAGTSVTAMRVRAHRGYVALRLALGTVERPVDRG